MAELGSRNLAAQTEAQRKLSQGGPEIPRQVADSLDRGAARKVEDRGQLFRGLAAVTGSPANRSGGQPLPSALTLTLARGLYENGDFQAALTMLSAMPASEGRDPETLLLKGTVQARGGLYTDALASFDQYLAIMKDPMQRSVALSNEGGILLKQGQFAAAEARLREALQLNASNGLARFNLGSLQLATGKVVDAAATFRDLLRLEPQNTQALILLAVAYQRHGEYNAAERALRTVLEQSPDNAIAKNNLAYLYALQRVKLDQAADLADGALKVDAGNARFLDTRGWIAHLQGDAPKALGLLQRAHAASPGDAEIKQHLQAVAPAVKSP